MSVWTNFRDKLTGLLLGYGLSKAVDKNTSWVETREQIKTTAVDEVVTEFNKSVNKK